MYGADSKAIGRKHGLAAPLTNTSQVPVVIPGGISRSWMEDRPDWDLPVASDYVHYGEAEAPFHFPGKAAPNPAGQTRWEGTDHDGRITLVTFRQLGFNRVDWR